MAINTNRYLLAACVTALSLQACQRDMSDVLISTRTKIPPQDNSNIYNGVDYTIWDFVKYATEDYYLWSPGSYDVDVHDYDSPQDLFEDFRHPDDRFSFVTSEYSKVESEMSNEYVTDGINYRLYTDGEDYVIAMVQYVYDNTPAAEAGVRRGFVIKEVNGTRLTKGNYQKLLNESSCVYGYTEARVNDQNVIDYSGTIKNTPTIVKRQCSINPVLKSFALQQDGLRVGYMLYDSFTKSADEIIEAVEKLKNQGVTELVLDLRLNGGGYITSLNALASMIVPSGNGGKLFFQSTYNDLLTKYYSQRDGADFDKEFFASNLPNLELKRLFVLTSKSTASASEELISGLKPYMPVTLIGKNTYGKFTSNILLNDQDDEGADSDGIPYSEWAVYLCVGSCKNSIGEMNFKDGFQVDYDVRDTYMKELGDPDEPLLQKALQLIEGGIAKNAVSQPEGLDGFVSDFGKPLIQYGAMIINK
ncbi:MAG: S41 family peptidase [Bacteroidales bacterium]|nr:S41 family peptidase [Bacteroidales bacterium]